MVDRSRGVPPPRPERIEVIDDETARIYASKSGAERLALASAMVASARRMLESHLRVEHPDWSEAALRREVARRIAGGAL